MTTANSPTSSMRKSRGAWRKSGWGTPTSEWLKKSMFQYLFSERVRALEEKDGIQRRVTLDKQFRMHPQLGDFVSRCFYETFDRTERFESGLPTGQFGHHLPGTDNAPAIWLDVPRTVGARKAVGDELDSPG
ncbi:MAG: AAA domain-containing protein [Candidatus Nanopelagicales bacterium]